MVDVVFSLSILEYVLCDSNLLANTSVAEQRMRVDKGHTCQPLYLYMQDNFVHCRGGGSTVALVRQNIVEAL